MQEENSDKTAKKGTLLCITTGKYSDYIIIGHFMAVKDFNPDSELKSYMVENPQDEKEKYHLRSDSFIAFLIRKGLIEEVTCDMIHTDSWGDIGEFSYIKDAKEIETS